MEITIRKPTMNKERLSKLAEDLLDIPSRISEIQGRILDHNEDIQTTNNEISQIEATIKSEIGAQLDDNGKKLYTNAESREAAFVEISNSNQELVSKRNRLSSLQGYVSIERIKMESLSNEQRNIRAVLYFFGGNFEDVV
jgi:predicted  nucleic acid-binding Zn-ribbon protein